MTLPILLLAITVTADFEGGSIGEVREVADNHIECDLEGETDQDGRNRQATWYYFRLDGVTGEDVTVDLVKLPGEYNYKPNRGAVKDGTVPFLSYDKRTWRPAPAPSYDAGIPRLRLRFTAERSPVWIAHVPPYTTEHLTRLLDEIGDHPHLKREVIGKTVEGRDMELLTVTDPSVDRKGKRVLWLMVRQHSWEAGSSWAGEGALRFLLSDAPEAERIRRETIFRIFPMCDPDGVARGGVRFNRHGYDLNRNWDAVDPEKMPEIAAQRKAVLDWVDSGRPIDLFVTLHNTESSEYLDGPPAGRDELMTRFFQALIRHSAFHPTRQPRHASLSTTPGKPGRMSVYQGLNHDRQIPSFLIEQMTFFNSRLGRVPTIEDRLAFGPGLVRAMREATQ
ncbi:MAG: carboxypeptidase family protein [bacterium]|nr:carboxypeptidase family protein [bacterium]